MALVTVKNVSGIGALYVPSLDVEVDAGDTLDVSQETAEALCAQPDNWALAQGGGK